MMVVQRFALALFLVAVFQQAAAAELVIGSPVPLGINSPQADFDPSVKHDGLSIYFATNRPGGTGGGSDIWTATRPSLGSPFGTPTPLSTNVNTTSQDIEPAIRFDGLQMYFRRSMETPVPDAPDADLFVANRASTGDPFGAAVPAGSALNSPSFDGSPEFSADGLTMIFSSTRPGGTGTADLWSATRSSLSDPFSNPVNLGPTVNSANIDGDPAISPDGLLLVFSSNRPGGLGGFDLWATQRASLADPFGTPVNLGPIVNTTQFDTTPDIGPDLTLYFARGETLGGLDIYSVQLVPEPSTWALLALGLALAGPLAYWRRRRS